MNSVVERAPRCTSSACHVAKIVLSRQRQARACRIFKRWRRFRHQLERRVPFPSLATQPPQKIKIKIQQPNKKYNSQKKKKRKDMKKKRRSVVAILHVIYVVAGNVTVHVGNAHTQAPKCSNRHTSTLARTSQVPNCCIICHMSAVLLSWAESQVQYSADSIVGASHAAALR